METHFLSSFIPPIRACLHEGGFPEGIGAPYLKEFPFPFVLQGSFYMRGRVPLGVGWGPLSLPLYFYYKFMLASAAGVSVINGDGENSRGGREKKGNVLN